MIHVARGDVARGGVRADTMSNVIVVLGCHRSGTSLMAGLLHHWGVYLGEKIRGGGPTNAKGHWENARITSAQQGLLLSLGTNWGRPEPLPQGWRGSEPTLCFANDMRRLIAEQFADKPLWGFKDPRTCRTLPVWQALFVECGFAPHYIIMVRYPREVAASLAARDGIASDHALQLYESHLDHALCGTAGTSRVVVHYESMLRDWRSERARIGRVLGISWPNDADAECDAFVTPELRHWHAIEGGANSLPTTVEMQYVILCELAKAE